jgi:hypothetical protein
MLAALLASPALVSALPPLPPPVQVAITQSLINQYPRILQIPSCMIAVDPKDFCAQDLYNEAVHYSTWPTWRHRKFIEDIQFLRELKQCQALNHPRLREVCGPVKQAPSRGGKSVANGFYKSPAKTQKTVRQGATRQARFYSSHQTTLISACEKFDSPSEKERCYKKIGYCNGLEYDSDKERCVGEKVDKYTAEDTPTTKQGYDDYRERKKDLVDDCQGLSSPSDRERCHKKIGNCNGLESESDKERCIGEKVEKYAAEKTRQKTKTKAKTKGEEYADKKQKEEIVGDCQSYSSQSDKESCLKKVIGLD